MEVKIGVQHASRELVLETDEDAGAIEKQVTEALSVGDGLLTLTDNRGRRTMIPASKLAYVEIGSGVIGQVGFRG